MSSHTGKGTENSNSISGLIPQSPSTHTLSSGILKLSCMDTIKYIAISQKFIVLQLRILILIQLQILLAYQVFGR